MVTLIIVIAVVLLLVLIIGSAYNKFVGLKNQGEEAAAQIDVHLKQRYDLIPNLVETVKGYAKHESSTLTAVINARNAAMNVSGGSLEEKDKADKAFEGTLKSLFALSESYPELKANQNFQDLQAQLTKLEGEILQARKYYNAVVKTFNTTIETFPNNLIAGFFGGKFKKMAYLEVNEAERQNVKVKKKKKKQSLFWLSFSASLLFLQRTLK